MFLCYRHFVVNNSPDEAYISFWKESTLVLEIKNIYTDAFLSWCFRGCMSHPYIKVFFCFHALLLHVFACLVLNIDWIFECAGIYFCSYFSFLQILLSKDCCSAVFSAEDSFHHAAGGQANFICMLSYLWCPRKNHTMRKAKAGAAASHLL